MSETHPLDLAALRQLYAAHVTAPPDAHTIKERLHGQERLLGAIPALLERLEAAEHAVTDAVITTHMLGHEAMRERLEQVEQERDDAKYSLELSRIVASVAREDAEKNAASARTAWNMQQQLEQERDTALAAHATTAKRAARLLERNTELSQRIATLEAAARAVLPHHEALAHYDHAAARDYDGIVPYYAEQWKKMLCLRDVLAALSPTPDDPAETERLVAIGMDVVRQVLAGTWKAPDEEE